MSKLQTAEGGIAKLQQGAGRRQAPQVAGLPGLFIGPFEDRVDTRLDRGLAGAFQPVLTALAWMRRDRWALRLSELSAGVISPDRAAPGAKRLSNPLRPPRWSHILLETRAL